MKIEFKKGLWEDVFDYVFSAANKSLPKFVQNENCISSRENPNGTAGYDHISILSKKMYTKGASIKVNCSFDSYGAPLILFTDKLYTDEKGLTRCNEYYEVVIFEDGINVWKVYADENAAKGTRLLGTVYPLEAVKIHDLKVELAEGAIRITQGDRRLYLAIDDMPESVYLGITACEGINHFYDCEISEAVEAQ